jgi:hypothetical protein
MPIIEISSLTHPGVDVFCMLTETQLRQRMEPGKGVFIAESPNVISRALDAGYEPLALMCERKHISGSAAHIIKRCGDVPVYTGDRELLATLTGYVLTRGVLCAMRRPVGHYGDGVGVIPIDIGNKIRLYCIRLSNKILIFGNGGVKDAKSWQQSTTLAPYVKLLIDTSRFIQSRIKDGTIVLVDKEIIGNLNFTRNEKK